MSGKCDFTQANDEIFIKAETANHGSSCQPARSSFLFEENETVLFFLSLSVEKPVTAQNKR